MSRSFEREQIDSFELVHAFQSPPRSFFPVLTRNGRRGWVAFPELAAPATTSRSNSTGLAPISTSPLSNSRSASRSLAFQPLRRTDWLRLWNDPPGPDEAAEAIAPFAHAFALDGDGPRFLQELGGLEGETTPIEALLIDTPGANGQKKNADVLTHREPLCRSRPARRRR